GSRLRRYSPLETIVLETIVPKAPSLAHWRQRTSLCAAPCLGSVAFTEVFFSAYVKTSRSCHTASRAWDGGDGSAGETQKSAKELIAGNILKKDAV
ncbi:hypothetical protein, partial [Desulfosporosinus sp. BG]|uniref:hypothetical protein n=1 Tax=Desulfosporosinus sp. BG TaxID=1633135 RepID=UPI001A9A3852